MSVVMANALGTGIFCGLWQGIGSVLGLATWMGFVGVCVLSCQEISTVAFCLVRS